MGRSFRRGSSFLRKLKPGLKQAEDGSAGNVSPPVAPPQPANIPRVDTTEMTALLKGLDKIDLSRPVRPPRRTDKRSNGSSVTSSSSTGSNLSPSVYKTAMDSPSTACSDDVFASPSRPTLTPSSSVELEDGSRKKSVAKGIFFTPACTTPKCSDSDSTKSGISPADFPKGKSVKDAVTVSCKPTKLTDTPASVKMTPVKHSPLKATASSSDDKTTATSTSSSEKTIVGSRARVEMKVNLLKPMLPVAPGRKVRIRTTATVTSSGSKKVAIIMPRMPQPGVPATEKDDLSPKKPSAPLEDNRNPADGTTKVVLRRTTAVVTPSLKGKDDEDEDEGIFSIEDVDAEELTKTDKAVLSKKKFSQLKIKNYALKVKDDELRERYAMLQSKRNRISSVTKRSSRSIRNSLIRDT